MTYSFAIFHATSLGQSALGCPMHIGRRAGELLALLRSPMKSLVTSEHTTPAPRQIVSVLFQIQSIGAVLQFQIQRQSADEATVLTVAADYPHKNLATLVMGMHILRKSYPKANLVLLGQGAERLVAGKTSAIPVSLPEYVHRLGYVSDETLAHWLSKATVFAAPSLFEGFGMTVVEAAVAGLPIAATPLKVYDETCAGAITPVREPLDPTCWAATLADLLSDPQRRRLSSDARLQLVDKLSLSVVGGAYYEMLRGLSRHASTV